MLNFGWGILLLLLAACSDLAKLPVEAVYGPKPALPAPSKSLIPTVNIAPAKGWSTGLQPLTAAGTSVGEFAVDLEHPRWLYVLPNGDVLVAESNAPPKVQDNKGIKSWVMGLVMSVAGAAVTSPNSITLLRDTNGDGVPDVRSVFLSGLNSPFGMALIGNELYVANTDAVLRFPYTTGDTQIKVAGRKLLDVSACPINHHWTKTTSQALTPANCT